MQMHKHYVKSPCDKNNIKSNKTAHYNASDVANNNSKNLFNTSQNNDKNVFDDFYGAI